MVALQTQSGDHHSQQVSLSGDHESKNVIEIHLIVVQIFQSGPTDRRATPLAWLTII